MKKLIVIMAATGLLAAGCASRKNQGGTNENNPNYSTGTTESSGAMDNSTSKGATGLRNGGTINTNAPENGTSVAPSSGGATEPGGNSSGTGQAPETKPENNNGATTPDSGNNSNTSTNSTPSDTGNPNP